MPTRRRLLSLAAALGVVLMPPAIHPVDAAAGPVYYLPATAGTKLVVTQGQNTAGDHDAAHYSQYALDFGIAGNGEFAVAAARAGTVIGLRDNSQAHCYMTAAGAYDWSCWKDANYVLVDHGDGSSALYVHLAMGTASVKVGDHVVAGQTLALDDNTGFSSANHLHFMVETTPTVPSTPPPGPTDKTAVAWWWTNSKPVAFSDPSVLAQASDGIPKYSMTVISGSPTPAPTPTPTATPTPTPTPTPSPTPSPTPTATPAPLARPGAPSGVTETVLCSPSFGGDCPSGPTLRVTWKGASGSVAGYRIYWQSVDPCTNPESYSPTLHSFGQTNATARSVTGTIPDGVLAARLVVVAYNAAGTGPAAYSSSQPLMEGVC
jgi:murein DD-endopeptidase MepM/ murein hydrolase activator NlpD